MYVPAQKDTLHAHILNTLTAAKNAAAQASDLAKYEALLDRQIYMGLLSPEQIAAYAAHILSDPAYMTNAAGSLPASYQDTVQPLNEKELELLDDIDEDLPQYTQAMGVISVILDTYLSDLQSVMRAISNKVDGRLTLLQKNSALGSLRDEILPLMLRTNGDIRTSTNGIRRIFSDTMTYAHRNGYFKSTGGPQINHCPFGVKVNAIFSLTPLRMGAEKVIVLPRGEQGALPEFIFRELNLTQGLKNPELPSPHCVLM